MPNIESLEELLQEELKDIYDAEKQLTKALPKLAKKASSPELKSAFEEHLRQTEQHVERLEQVFEQMEIPARGKKCEGMKHLISEGEDMAVDRGIGDAHRTELGREIAQQNELLIGARIRGRGLVRLRVVLDIAEKAIEDSHTGRCSLVVIESRRPCAWLFVKWSMAPVRPIAR